MNNKKYFEEMSVTYEWSENSIFNYRYDEGTTFKGIEAYNFIKDLIQEDKLKNEQKERGDGGDKPYDKTKITNLKLSKDFEMEEHRIPLGNLRFGGKEKVSDALEHFYNNYDYHYEKKGLEKAISYIKENEKNLEQGNEKTGKKTGLEIVQEERIKTTEEFVGCLKKDGLKFIKRWSEVESPSNGTTGKTYHGGNAIKLYMDVLKKGYDDTRYVTKKQAEKEGWKIKDKEKGVMCEKWIFTKKEKKINEKTGKEEEREVKLKKPIANYFIVYNANQIEGIPNQELKEKIPTNYADLIKNLERSSECEINKIAQNNAYYTPAHDTITMPTLKQFNSEQNYIATLIHEMAHSTGHESRLNRDLTGQHNLESYAKEELRAEISAVFLQKELGIEVKGENLNSHEAYVASWIKTLESDPNEIYRAGAEAEKITDYLKENYLSLEKTNDITVELSQDPWKKNNEKFKSNETSLEL